MIKKIIALLLAVFLVACSKAPDAHDVNGKPISLSDYRGQWVLVNYWAEWCAPCLKELPAFEAFYRAHKGHVMILAVNFDGNTPQQIQSFAKKWHLTFPILSAFPIEKLGLQNIAVLPSTVVLNPKGERVRVLQGPQTQKTLEKILLHPALS